MKGLGTLADWAKGDLNLEVFTEPSMVEPVHNLSLEEIMRDYRLGITHTMRTPMYDKGDDVPDTPLEIMDDITDFHPGSHPFQVSLDLGEDFDDEIVPKMENNSEKLSPAGEEKCEETTD